MGTFQKGPIQSLPQTWVIKPAVALSGQTPIGFVLHDLSAPVVHPVIVCRGLSGGYIIVWSFSIRGAPTGEGEKKKQLPPEKELSKYK